MPSATAVGGSPESEVAPDSAAEQSPNVIVDEAAEPRAGPGGKAHCQGRGCQTVAGVVFVELRVRESDPSQLHGSTRTVRLRTLALVVMTMAVALAACTNSAAPTAAKNATSSVSTTMSPLSGDSTPMTLSSGCQPLRVFPQPPPGFDPVAATAAQLQEYGFPPRPPGNNAEALAAWTKAVRAAKHLSAPSPVCGAEAHFKALPQLSSDTKQPPVVDLSATPTGWVPVAFGNAQISVPATWWVLYNSPPCPTGSPPGEVFVNPLPGVFHCPPDTAPGPSTAVRLGPPTSPQSDVLGYPEVINGIAVYPYPTGPRSSYLVPVLAVQITVDGPLGSRVLHTLTRSPRTQALASGPAPPVPLSWRSVSFAGLRFSVPAGWSVTRTSGAADGLGNPCATPGVAFPNNEASLLSYGVTLSTDQHLLPPNACGLRTFDAPQPPMDGVQVDSGPHIQFHVTLSFSKHCLHIHGLTACPATSLPYSILVLRVTVPGRSKPVYVSIGLAESGMIARTILYSLHSASTSDSAALATVDPPNFVLATLPASGAGDETVVALYSPVTGRVVRFLHLFGSSFTNNGLALSPDGAEVYVTLIGSRSLLLERISVATKEMTFVAYGELPALSPNGRFLAYVVGTSDHELAIRDLSNGRTRYVDLAALLGRSENLMNGTITWLGDGSEVVVLPGGQLVAYGPDQTTTTEPPLKGSCDAVAASNTCLIVVHAGATGVLSARKLVVSELARDPNPIIAGDASYPRSLLVARWNGRHTFVDRIDLSTSAARVVALMSLKPVLPVAFDPAGSRLLYLVAGTRPALWIARLEPGRLVAAHRLIANAQLGAGAW